MTTDTVRTSELAHSAALVLVAFCAMDLGTVLQLALAPLHWLPLAFIAFPGVFLPLKRLCGTGGGFALSWLFGFGLLVMGLAWIAESFSVNLEKLGELGFPTMLALSASLALFSATGCATGRRLGSPLVLMLKLGVVAAPAVWSWRVRSRIEALAIGLVLGGVLGKVLNRVQVSAVVNVLDWHHAGWD